ncbi:MAG: Hpt domain-containing protein [Nitrospiraceae bacterium]
MKQNKILSQDGTKIVVHIDPDLQDIVPGFLENRRRDVQSMNNAISQKDFDAIRVIGHRMKGDGGGYGFDAISEIGAALEQASARRDMPAITRNLNALADYLQCVEVVYGS